MMDGIQRIASRVYAYARERGVTVEGVGDVGNQPSHPRETCGGHGGTGYNPGHPSVTSAGTTVPPICTPRIQ